MKTSNAALIAVTAMFCTAILGVALVACFAGGEEATLVAQLLGALAVTIPSVLALAKVSSVEGTVNDLANGKMDAKIRAGVADVLAPHLIDPASEEQVKADRVRRDTDH